MSENEDLVKTEEDLVRFEKIRAFYAAKARDHKPARIDLGDDTPYYNTVLEEMLLDVFNRLAKLEEILSPGE